MKNGLYIGLIMLLVMGCARNEHKAASVEAEMDVVEETDGLSGFIEEVLTTTEVSDESSMVSSSEALAAEKLQDYFDLLTLAQEHPKFRRDIRSQLERLSENNQFLGPRDSFRFIVNIRQKGSVERISDSVQHLQFYFDRIDGLNRSVDSITAVLRTKKVVLDGQEISSPKVTFKYHK